jgi:Fe-S oxidoreductase/FAD/FMN-containing dehydrogenase
MAANNASGARSIRFGKMVDHVLEAKIFVPGGDQALLKAFNESEWESKIREESPTGSVVRAVVAIQEHYKQDILAHFPTLDRHVSGYNLDEAVKSLHPNLAKLVVGSEGSLGLITSLKLSIVKKPDHLGLALIHFHTLEEAFKALPQLLHWDYLSLELVDHKLLKMAAEVPRIKQGMGWIFGDPGAILIAEFDTESVRDTQLKLSSFEADMRHHGIGYAYYLMTRPEEMKQVWDMRKSGLGLLMSKRSYTNAIAFLEDMAVPPTEVAPFMDSFLKLLRQNELEAGVYGHVGVGCLHIRPYLNLSDPKDLEKITPLMQQAAELILKHKGSLSGEHGDGLIRSWLNETLFGSRVMEAFHLLKQAFDPLNLMNPGKVVNGIPFDDLQDDLRLNPKTALNTIPTYLNFEKEGGFALTADLCNGNGECRKQTGIMCPSFQATLDEFNTTRARANVLQGMIHKTKGAINWNDPSVRKVLDLCLECKGCKTECPSAVDMTKLKMEFLYHYNSWNGISLRTRFLSSFSKWVHLGSLMPRFTAWLLTRDWVKRIQKWLQIAPERAIPTPAPERFSTWFSRNVQGKQTKGKQVVLFNDTYTEFLYPEVGISAVKILHLLGYEVILPPWRCCGRPLLSKGRLKKGQKAAVKLMRTLTPYLKAKIPVLGLEPSCLFTLLDEYQDLPDLDAKALKSVAKTFDRFIFDHLEEGQLPLKFKPNGCKIKVHGHCHEKAIEGIEATLAILRAIPGAEVEAIPSGCCGMAGAFGYEQEHYDLSMKIGELVLLPEVRRASKETLIVANGFSCRTQISDGAGRSAIHLAEALNRLLEDNPKS